MTQSKPQSSPTLLLSGAMLAELMRPSDYLAAVETGFRASRDGRAVSPPPLQLDASGGAFHAKAAVLNGAYAAFEEKEKGSLTPGKLADLVVLSKDIMTVPEDQIPTAVPDLTIVGGKVAYRRAGQ